MPAVYVKRSRTGISWMYVGGSNPDREESNNTRRSKGSGAGAGYAIVADDVEATPGGFQAVVARLRQGPWMELAPTYIPISQ